LEAVATLPAQEHREAHLGGSGGYVEASEGSDGRQAEVPLKLYAVAPERGPHLVGGDVEDFGQEPAVPRGVTLRRWL